MLVPSTLRPPNIKCDQDVSIESLFHQNFESTKTSWRDHKTNPYLIQAFWRDMFAFHDKQFSFKHLCMNFDQIE